MKNKKEEIRNPISWQDSLIGIGTILITVLMADGGWDIFDLGMSLSILILGYYFVSNNNILEGRILPITLIFGIVLTAFFLALFSVIAIYNSDSFWAKSDKITYSYIFKENTIEPLELYKINAHSIKKSEEEIFDFYLEDLRKKKLKRDSTETNKLGTVKLDTTGIRERQDSLLFKLANLIDREYVYKYDLKKAIKKLLNNDEFGIENIITEHAVKIDLIHWYNIIWQFCIYIFSNILCFLFLSIRFGEPNKDKNVVSGYFRKFLGNVIPKSSEQSETISSAKTTSATEEEQYKEKN